MVTEYQEQAPEDGDLVWWAQRTATRLAQTLDEAKKKADRLVLVLEDLFFQVKGLPDGATKAKLMIDVGQALHFATHKLAKPISWADNRLGGFREELEEIGGSMIQAEKEVTK